MANIQVDSLILQRAADDERDIDKKLSDIEGRITQVALNMGSITISSASMIKTALINSSKGVIAQRGSVMSLRQSLNQINNLYEKTEINLLNQGENISNGPVSSASVTADWLGYELSDGNSGVTAWIGKTSAEVQNELAYAGVNAYLFKCEVDSKADFDFMNTESKTEYKNGEWSDKSTTTFLAAEVVAGASASVFAVDVDAGIGSDMLGIGVKAEGNAGNATAEVKGKLSVGEDGINAYAKGEAMVSAVEGKAEGSINILGLEITGKVGGYAGALGVEGKIGVEKNKFVLKGGAAALIGGSVGLEIGLNDEGWDNFVDFVTFWD